MRHLCRLGSQQRTGIERVEEEAQCQMPGRRVGGCRIVDIEAESLPAVDSGQVQ